MLMVLTRNSLIIRHVTICCLPKNLLSDTRTCKIQRAAKKKRTGPPVGRQNKWDLYYFQQRASPHYLGIPKQAKSRQLILEEPHSCFSPSKKSISCHKLFSETYHDELMSKKSIPVTHSNYQSNANVDIQNIRKKGDYVHQEK